ncbi:hypothetical protein L7F22_014349 [Adiantum nelumboides]|nr:hypothetical protein [Adiantum nelumboides]
MIALVSLMVLATSPRGDVVDTSDDDGDSCDTDDMEEFFEEHQSGHLDAFAFASTRYFANDRQTYNLMIVSIESGQAITIGALKAHDKRGWRDWRVMTPLFSGLQDRQKSPYKGEGGVKEHTVLMDDFEM